jgi:Zn-dependent alcohol dehydrogenase
MTVRAWVAALPPRRQLSELHAIVLPQPGPFEAVVEQSATGIRHSRLHQSQTGSRTRP